jgi:hypothetical protein
VVTGCNEQTRYSDRHCHNHRKEANKLEVKSAGASAANILNIASEASNWACLRCTFHNGPDRQSCEMCGAPKLSPTGTEECIAHTEENEEFWICAKCEMRNASHISECETCDEPSSKKGDSLQIKSAESNATTEQVITQQGGETDGEVTAIHPDQEVATTVLAADGSTFDLGQMKNSQTILSLKKVLAEKSGMSVGGSQLYVVDDNREGIDDLKLRNSEIVEQVMTYTASSTELHMMVLQDGGHECQFTALSPSLGFKQPHAFDTGGALYFLGSNGNTTEYTNPHTLGAVVSAMSSVDNEYGAVDRFVRHASANDWGDTNWVKSCGDDASNWMSVDLGENRSLDINHYCMRHGNHNGDRRPQNWRLEGSKDGSAWVMLREHNNDETMPYGGYAVGDWEVDNVGESFRHFRVFQTGRSSGGSSLLAVAGFELYGILYGA